MRIHGLLGYFICSFLIASGLILVGPQGGRLHPDIEARREALFREIRAGWKCLRNGGALAAIPAVLQPVQLHPGCYVGADFELSGRAAFEVDEHGKIRSSPMTAIRAQVDVLPGERPLNAIARSWAADAVIHQLNDIQGSHAAFLQRSVKYGDYDTDVPPTQRRTQILLTALITAIVAPEVATSEALHWQLEGNEARLLIQDYSETLIWQCRIATDEPWSCETGQAELGLAGGKAYAARLHVSLGNWQIFNQQKMPRDWVISWGDQDWVEFRGQLQAVRREPPPPPGQAARPG